MLHQSLIILFALVVYQLTETIKHKITNFKWYLVICWIGGSILGISFQLFLTSIGI